MDRGGSAVRSVHAAGGRGLVQQWQENPKSLFDALLVDADEMTHKRYAIIWDALDDVDTFESVEYA